MYLCNIISTISGVFLICFVCLIWVKKHSRLSSLLDSFSHLPSVCVCVLTGLRGVRLSPLGSQAVLPADVRVLDEASDVVEEAAEAHAGGVVHCVVQQGRAPQVGLFP